MGLGRSHALSRGRKLLPFEYDILEGCDVPECVNSICFTIPWADLITRAWNYVAENEPIRFYDQFDKDATLTTPPKFQVSVWYDVPFTDEDDSGDSGDIMNLSDFLPNADGGDKKTVAQGTANDTVDSHCDKLENRLDICLDLMVGGSEIDYNTCKAIQDAGDCIAANCTWYLNSPSNIFPCMLDMPIMDWDKTNLDGVGAVDFGIFKREQGRSSGM
jgi:hypothetical protein